jgi:hypothetical protein
MFGDHLSHAVFVEVTMTIAPPPPPPKKLSHSQLVQHDIQLARDPAQPSKVVASVTCERLGCDVLVEACARCPRFARIETHEAGYVLLCRAHEDTSDPEACDCPGEPELR